jgi:S1-C subfamily serine protease
MFFSPAGNRSRVLSAAVLAGLACVAGAAPVAEDGDVPQADAFAPQDISIGEPLQLPFQRRDDAVDPLPRQAQAQPGQSAREQRPAAPFAAPQPSPPAADAAGGPRTVPSAPANGGGWLGLSVDDSIVTGRLVVVDVAPHGPAAVAGIEPRDELLAINGTPLRSADDFAGVLAAIGPGMEVKMAVSKGDHLDEIVVEAAPRPRESTAPAWQPLTDSAPPTPAAPNPVVVAPPADRLGERQQPLPEPQQFVPPTAPPAVGSETLPAPALSRANPPADAGGTQKGRTALGVRTVPIDPTMQARFQLPEQSGAFVIGVVHDLPASKAGVPPGSVIVAIDDQPVRDPADLSRLVTSGPVGTPVPLQFVLPGGESRRIEVRLQPLDMPLEKALIGETP